MSCGIDHDWTLTPREAVAQQRELAAKISVTTPLGPVRLVAGVDVAYDLGGELVHAAVVVWDRETATVVERQAVERPPSFPYLPGLLSFRELPPLLAAFRKLRHVPDVTLCDGQGYAHPRRIGLASHLGLCLGRPTIGSAKSVLCGTYEEPGAARGSRSPLVDEGEVIGYALRTQDGVKPVYVSPGHLCTFEDACELVLALATKYRLPEPIRAAHGFANELRSKAGQFCGRWTST